MASVISSDKKGPDVCCVRALFYFLNINSNGYHFFQSPISGAFG